MLARARRNANALGQTTLNPPSLVEEAQPTSGDDYYDRMCFLLGAQTFRPAQSVAWGEGRAADPIESQGMKGYETISRAAVDFGQREAGAATHTIDERINR